MRFGERLRELRRARHLSQRTLGSKIGVSFTYISKVENDKLSFGDYPSENSSQALEGLERASRLHAALVQWTVHAVVLRFCNSEILQANYFHAVFEAMKSIAAKVRSL